MNEENLKKEEAYLFGTAEGFSEYLSDVLKDSEYSEVKDAMARAVLCKGIGDTAQEAKVSRVSLYRGYVARSNEPSLENFLAVLNALGVELTAAPKNAAS
jgi:probable addiction module antidote protein